MNYLLVGLIVATAQFLLAKEAIIEECAGDYLLGAFAFSAILVLWPLWIVIRVNDRLKNG